MADNEDRSCCCSRTCGRHRAKEAEQIAAHYAPNIVLYTLAPPLRTRWGEQLSLGGGRKADMTTAHGIRAWMAGFGGEPFDYKITDLSAAVGGNVAYAHGLSRKGRCRTSPCRTSISRLPW